MSIYKINIMLLDDKFCDGCVLRNIEYDYCHITGDDIGYIIDGKGNDTYFKHPRLTSCPLITLKEECGVN